MLPSSAASSSGDAWRPVSKCMTDSRSGDSRAWRTWTIRPSPSRSVPITGWTTRRISRPRALSSSETESTRNGESTVFVSTTDPTVVYPSLASVGLNARTANGSEPRPSASSKTPMTWPNSSSGSRCTATSAGMRLTYARANSPTTPARSGATCSSIFASSSCRSRASTGGVVGSVALSIVSPRRAQGYAVRSLAISSKTST